MSPPLPADTIASFPDPSPAIISIKNLTEDYLHRFHGIARLYGMEGLASISHSHVCIIGVGGVGSWIVEALARSGIGQLTLIDLDDVCVTNTNRQLPALDGNVGRLKIDVLAERARRIQPEIEIQKVAAFVTRSNVERLLAGPFDVVIDAIDVAALKARIFAFCRDQKTACLVLGGAGGLRDPSQIRQADLSQAIQDPLLAKVRTHLRREFGFPAGGQKMRVPCVYSSEQPVFPWSNGEVCHTRENTKDDMHLNCASGFGSATHVTGSFGFVAAGWAIEQIIGQKKSTPASK